MGGRQTNSHRREKWMSEAEVGKAGGGVVQTGSFIFQLRELVVPVRHP